MNISMDEETLKMNLAENIRFLRLAHNPRITQAELAEKLGIPKRVFPTMNRPDVCRPPMFLRLLQTSFTCHWMSY